MEIRCEILIVFLVLSCNRCGEYYDSTKRISILVLRVVTRIVKEFKLKINSCFKNVASVPTLLVELADHY